MATYLYRLGKFAYRRKWIVTGVCLLVLALMGLAAGTMKKPTSDTFSIPGIPSEQAMNLVDERFPGAKQGGLAVDSATAKFVFAAPDGESLDTPGNEEAVERLVDAIRALPQLDAAVVQQITNPVTTSLAQFQASQVNATLPADQRNPQVPDPADLSALLPLNIESTDHYPAHAVAYVQVNFDVPSAADVSEETKDAIDAAAEIGRESGLTVGVSGSATAAAASDSNAELIGIAVAALVLALTFGSLVAAGLPLITALLGVAIGSLGITAATGIWELSSATPVLAMMIGLAVAIDYALFVVSRYKHELTLGDDREEAVGRAVGTAGSAVVFAGTTVFIALVALSVVRIPFLTAMGLAAAFTVVIAVIIALTLLPALLGIFGGKVFAGKIPGIGNRAATGGSGIARRYIGVVVRRPALTLLLGVVLLGVLAIPVTKLDLALPDDASAAPGSPQHVAYDLLSDGFGVGANGPLIVVADAREVPDRDRMQAFGTVVGTVARLDDVRNAQMISVNPEGDTAMIQVIPSSGPDDRATQQLVNAIRDTESALTASTGGVEIGVTGQTAVEGDVSQRLMDSLLPYLAIVVGLAFVLLTLVFRSILVPLTAALGFLLSVAATFGVTVAIFQEGMFGLIGNPQPIVSFLPIFLIGVVFGLAMDYQVFLVTRMREEFIHTGDAKPAVVEGFVQGSRVVTAAAVIMIAVFAAFIAEPDTLIKSIGFALAAAVVFDAFVVRMFIIPAAMSLLGDKAWWLPGWLDRALPNIDIEGENITPATRESGDDDLVKV